MQFDEKIGILTGLFDVDRILDFRKSYNML